MSTRLAPAEVGRIAEEAEKGAESSVFDPGLRDLKQRTVQGAAVSALAQSVSFALRIVSMIVLARLLWPRDFGVVGMVTAVTGVLGLFRDVGLSMAMVQRGSVTRDQMSTLFWINVTGGGILAGMCCMAGPVLVWFYDEPRLFEVAVVISMTFICNGGAAQHRAILQRAMRFQALACLDTIPLALGLVIAVSAAVAGAGYWAIVLMTVSPPLWGALGAWIATRWIPGAPRRGTGVRAMLWYGGTVTLNSVVMYLAYNIDKVLVGRFWGADALGIYGRAFQLVSIPTENLNYTMGLVAFPALSRVQREPARLRDYFLMGYGLFLSISIPVTAGILLFPEEIVEVFLGARWAEAAGVLRLLAPTILTLAVINPLAWLMLATGRTGRSLKIALLIGPVVVAGSLLGLSAGPKGVAVGLSSALLVLAAPVAMWAKHGTAISARDIGRTILYPVLSIVVAAVGVYAVHGWTTGLEPAVVRLVVETGALWGIYGTMLWWVCGRGAVYTPLLREIRFWPGRLGRSERESR